MQRRNGAAAWAAWTMVAVLAGCGEAEQAGAGERTASAVATDTQAVAPAPTPAPTPPPPPSMSLEVNLAERALYVRRDGEPADTYPVAVGSKEWPTPTGEWTISQVIWNPRWIPPQEEWAKDEEEKEPGDPENPLGRAQLVYRAPNSIHGTNQTSSLGKAVSHGSIRVSNETAMKLARQAMEAGGAGKDEAWYRAARENRKERREVILPNPIPIRVVEGGSNGAAAADSAGRR